MDIKAARYTANYPDEFVVLLIGLRVNQLWRVNEWWPVLRAAFAMTQEAKALPNSPLLESMTVLSVSDWRVVFFIQYWRSFDELMSWADNSDLQHKPAQKAFFKRTAYNGHVGVWHETYKVAAGQFEAIYANMPQMGLAAAGTYRELRKSSKGRDRMGDRNAH
ncbi:phenylacetaldoxime dehydratase family protein [Pseudonocardia xishanensis]|uniref:DUF4188 domain-containing protein n=1 Tax=Pseudonocardia xishanensis TaxID=630995 RepID=A0ABP8REW7_9PSEU